MSEPRVFLTALLSSIAFGVTSTAVGAADLYVSPAGNDGGSGARGAPYATLQKARDAARELPKPVTIYLAGGTYYLPETLVLNPEDSGVTWQANEGETPIVSGGVKLDLQWRAFKEGIKQATVPNDLVTEELFLNGDRQVLARYPNFDPQAKYFNGYAADAISKERVARWADPAGGYFHAMHPAMWGGFTWRITGKDDKGEIAKEGGWQNNRGRAAHPTIRYVENIFEELDAPGEWFLNRKTHALYFYPPAGVDVSKATVEATRLATLIELHGTREKPVKSVTLKGITFRHANRTVMETKEPILRTDWAIYRGGAILVQGTEDCRLEDLLVDQVSGNAIFVNFYNRRVSVRGCEIVKAGANGVVFLGDAKAARNPLFNYDQRLRAADLDRTPGPKTENYPADCRVDDCLIHLTGRVEKQTAGVNIDLAQNITVRHCSIYDMPRAGINIGDGCWGGHVIEFCDVFDTVKETGDHGSFNSWGRDRFWGLNGLNLNDDKTWDAEKDLPRLDAMKTTVLRNNRWRCDHGWDIDLDDGSSNYQIVNNLCLRGGLKNREGFFRVVENNIIVNNGFHPHVWYKHSQDVVRRNIFGTDHYLPAGGMPAFPWGREMDFNLVHQPGITVPQPAKKLVQQSKRDDHSVVADALFCGPERGDYRVKEGSPALKLGFVNFPMDQFGVQKPALKAIARTPEFPKFQSGQTTPTVAAHFWLGMSVRELTGEEYSAFGVAKDSGGVQVLRGANSGIETGDLIQAVNGQSVKTFADLMCRQNEAAGKSLEVGIVRKQQPKKERITTYPFVSKEDGTPAVDPVPIREITTKPATVNDPVATLTDGRLAESYGPVFANGTVGGAYKADLGQLIDIAEVKTWSYDLNKGRGTQRFVLFGSNVVQDPGWDSGKYTPIIEVDTTGVPIEKFSGTKIRAAGDKSIGAFRWLIWVVQPVTPRGENTAFQEFQIQGKRPPK
ncbi:MAG TPA: PDZ domain-containing protein [Fimbriiglobus sp.]|jgi:hypothetical protein